MPQPAMEDATHSSRYEQFLRIDADKQRRIIGAALEEFANNNYAQASTNAIVARAGISKGLLFHYFGDKEGLHRYLQSYVYHTLLGDIMAQESMAGGDVFDILTKVVYAKLHTTAKYPLEARFLVRALTGELPPALRTALNASVDQSYGSLASITAHLDPALLKDGIDREQVGKIVTWVCEGLTNEALATIDPATDIDGYAQLTRYVEGYFDFLRRLFYKDGVSR
jgi:AcrR family transcriptional regulator